ncbi:complement C1q-like protein 4 [Saccostrea cucullata]|uniref:complement C1q-like protein 4 n=1 Tax=Saccostrea cuccullata TaxID=36930 RepID=UPI002ED194A2
MSDIPYNTPEHHVRPIIMQSLILTIILLISSSFSDFLLNPSLELNGSAIAHGPEKKPPETIPDTSDKLCSKPTAVYKSDGPINIYLNGGLIQNEKGGLLNFTTDQKTCNCPPGPPGPRGERGPQGPRGNPGSPGGSTNATREGGDKFVAFSVVMEARPFGPYSYYKIIQFDNVISNVGSGYDEEKGVFTAPIPGYYQFNVHAHTIVHKQAEIRVMFNSERVVSVWADGRIGEGEKKGDQNPPMSPFMPATNQKPSPQQVHEMGSSNSFIIRVNRGQKVYCLLPANQVLAGLGFSSFSGHLLSVAND